MIIDFHTHTYPPKIAKAALDKLQKAARACVYTDGTDEGLRRSMQEAHVDYSVLLPVVTNPAKTRKINELAVEKNNRFRETGLISFGGIHPDSENYKEELRRLYENGIRGVKLHPPYASVNFDDCRYMRIVDEASNLGLITLVHAGLDIGIPLDRSATVERILNVIHTVHPRNLVLAHCGAWRLWDEVEEKLCTEDVYFDLAYTLGKLVAPEGTSRREDECALMPLKQLKRIIEKHGSDRILYATDSPWSSQKDTIELLKNSDIPKPVLEKILGENARKLLKL